VWAFHLFDFTQVQASEGKKADLLYLNGLVAQKRGEPVSDVMNLLNDAIDTHFTDVKVGKGSKFILESAPLYVMKCSTPPYIVIQIPVFLLYIHYHSNSAVFMYVELNV